VTFEDVTPYACATLTLLKVIIPKI